CRRRTRPRGRATHSTARTAETPLRRRYDQDSDTTVGTTGTSPPPSGSEASVVPPTDCVQNRHSIGLQLQLGFQLAVFLRSARSLVRVVRCQLAPVSVRGSIPKLDEFLRLVHLSCALGRTTTEQRRPRSRPLQLWGRLHPD